MFTAGGVRSLYAGIGPTLMGIVPYGGLSFAAFETMKTFYKKANDHDWDEDRMPLAYKLAAGGCAGFVAQTVTYPLHVVRRRMQVHGGGIYAGVWEGLRDIYAKEGAVNGLFKGVGLTWLKGPIAAAIGFTANDVLKLAVPATRRALLDAASKPPEPTPATYLEAKQVNAIESLVAGGLAGAVAKTTIAPADRVKIIYQVDPHRPFTLASAARTARDIVVTEGPLGLWRGNGVMMARVVPYAGVTFLSYPRYEAAAKRACETIFGDKAGEGGGEEGGGKRIAVRFIAGSAAGATATTLTYPLDLMRARYAASGTVALSTPGGGGFVKPAMKVGASASQTRGARDERGVQHTAAGGHPGFIRRSHPDAGGYHTVRRDFVCHVRDAQGDVEKTRQGQGGVRGRGLGPRRECRSGADAGDDEAALRWPRGFVRAEHDLPFGHRPETDSGCGPSGWVRVAVEGAVRHRAHGGAAGRAVQGGDHELGEGPGERGGEFLRERQREGVLQGAARDGDVSGDERRRVRCHTIKVRR